MDHARFMQRCLELAKQGRGLVGGNPLVGAVLVRGDDIVAEGVYKGTGTDHAEVNLIKNCVQKIQQEDKLYVSLEPCNHHGKTPPCTQAIIDAGIRHVVYGMVDPDPRVEGKGIAALRQVGISVVGPVCRAECERLNRGFVSLRTKGRPFVTLKRAQTREGKVANDDGTKLCITSKEQNTWSHQFLRATHDAILVGVQTVITDNPQLTIRLPQSPVPSPHQPYTIVLDPDLRIPLDANAVGERLVLIRKDSEESEESEDSKERELVEKGATVLRVPMEDDHFVWSELWRQFSILHPPFSTLLVEGGPTTWQAFQKAGLVDEEVTLIG